MQWPNFLAKFSPERNPPILREGQCRPVSDYTKVPNMPSDDQESPPAMSTADDPDDGSSIGDSSLFAPPMAHRQLPSFTVPQHDLQGVNTLVDGLSGSHDPPTTLATAVVLGSPLVPSVPLRAMAHTHYPDETPPLSPQAPRLSGPIPPSNAPPPQQLVIYPGGYAPVETLPPQNYIVPARMGAPLSAPPFYPASHGTSLLSQPHSASPHPPSSPTVAVPPNSELARPPRFTFAPPGAHVPADPVVVATTGSPTSAAGGRNKRERAQAKTDKALQQTQERLGNRVRSNSWGVVPSIFRRKSGRQSGPATPPSDTPPRLSPSEWRDLAKWAYRATDNSWGEYFEEYNRPMPLADASLPVEMESSSPDSSSLPPLPAHLSHLTIPTSPLPRTDSSTSALNPFLTTNLGQPALSWDLRTTARAILFPASTPTVSALPMASTDYAQPATWPPCGALRIGAIVGHTKWRWPVDVRNPAGVRCGDVFRALVANLHEFVHAHELASMSPEYVGLVSAMWYARVAAGMPPGSASPDGIRRVDCLLGYTQFHALVPGPSPGEWTMIVGTP